MNWSLDSSHSRTKPSRNSNVLVTLNPRQTRNSIRPLVCGPSKLNCQRCVFRHRYAYFRKLSLILMLFFQYKLIKDSYCCCYEHHKSLLEKSEKIAQTSVSHGGCYMFFFSSDHEQNFCPYWGSNFITFRYEKKFIV